MTEAFVCGAMRTPLGRFGGAMAGVRADDLGAPPIRALPSRNHDLEPAAVEEVFYGCANQSGEDNLNVARLVAVGAGTTPAAYRPGVLSRTLLLDTLTSDSNSMGLSRTLGAIRLIITDSIPI